MVSTKIVVIKVDRIDGVDHATAIPDNVPVSGANTLLSFYLDSPGYAFVPQRAVVITEKNDEPIDEDPSFPINSWTTAASSVALLDTLETIGCFKYRVDMINLTTLERFSLDPSITNGMGDPG